MVDGRRSHAASGTDRGSKDKTSESIRKPSPGNHFNHGPARERGSAAHTASRGRNAGPECNVHTDRSCDSGAQRNGTGERRNDVRNAPAINPRPVVAVA